MTELKSLGRQISQPGPPDISAAAQASSIIGQTINAVSQTLGEQVANKRKAAEEMQSEYAVLEGQRELGLQLNTATQNPMSDESSIEEFNKTQSEIINRLLESIPSNKQKEVKLRLMKQAVSNELKIAEHVGSSRKQALKDTDAAMFYDAGKQAYEFAAQGGEVDAAELYVNTRNARLALVNSGDLSELDFQKGQDKIAQSIINGNADYGYRQAWEKDGERGAAQYLKEFHDSEHEGITQEQKELAFNHLMGTANDTRSSLAQVGQFGYQSVVSDIYSTARPKDESQMQARIEQESEQGYPLSGMQAFKAMAKWKRLNNKLLEEQKSNVEIASAISRQDVGALINTSSSKLDKYFIDTRKALTEKVAEDVNGAQTDAQRIVAQKEPWMISASIAAEVPVPIPQFQDELHTQLTSLNPDDILNAVKAYEYASVNNKNSVDGMSGKDEAFLKAVGKDLASTTMQPLEVIQKYKDAILDVDPTVAKNRQESYTKLIKDKPNFINKIVDEAFGRKILNTLASPGADLYAAVQDRFEQEYLITGDYNQAKDNVVEYMKDNAGDSIFGPKKVPVWNPQENLPFYDFGNIVRNQSTKYLKELASSAAKNPGRLPYKVEWSDKMPPMPDKISEQDLFDGQYDKGEWWLKIDDVDRRVYFISGNYNQSNAFPVTTYQVMYEKGGHLQNLMTLAPTLAPNGKLQTNVQGALMNYYGPNEITPNLVRQMEAESASEAMERGAVKAYQSKVGPSDLYIDGWIFEDKGKKKNAKARQIIEGEKAKVGKSLEKEKIRRQQQETKDFLQIQGEGP